MWIATSKEKLICRAWVRSVLNSDKVVLVDVIENFIGLQTIKLVVLFDKGSQQIRRSVIQIRRCLIILNSWWKLLALNIFGKLVDFVNFKLELGVISEAIICSKDESDHLACSPVVLSYNDLRLSGWISIQIVIDVVNIGILLGVIQHWLNIKHIEVLSNGHLI